MYLNASYSYRSRNSSGGIISPILANLTLDGLEKILADKYHTNTSGRIDSNHAAKYKVNFSRYADDFIVTGKNRGNS